jgi:uncharacterized protein (UPF0212 family)
VTATQPLQLSPITASIDNPGDWESIARTLESATGLPVPVTPDLIQSAIAGAVPLLFEADATNRPGLLRGTFADPVVAQCQRNPGNLLGERPASVEINLVGAHLVATQSVVRTRLTIQVTTAEGGSSVNRQFWDLAFGSQVTVGQTTCPNCGAPLGQGELICGHCQTDVRRVVNVPLVVSHVELY